MRAPKLRRRRNGQWSYGIKYMIDVDRTPEIKTSCKKLVENLKQQGKDKGLYNIFLFMVWQP
jgi:hypothetical protein